MNGVWLASYVVLWVLVVVSSLLTLATLRQLGLVYARQGGSLGALQTPEGLPIGESLPATEVFDVLGVSRSLVPISTPFALVLLMSPTCQVCEALIPALPMFARGVKREAELLVILTSGDHNEGIDAWHMADIHHAIEPALVDLLRVPATPYALAIDREGRVASKGIVNDVEQVESVLNEAAASPRYLGASHD